MVFLVVAWGRLFDHSLDPDLTTAFNKSKKIY